MSLSLTESLLLTLNISIPRVQDENKSSLILPTHFMSRSNDVFRVYTNNTRVLEMGQNMSSENRDF